MADADVQIALLNYFNLKMSGHLRFIESYSILVVGALLTINEIPFGNSPGARIVALALASIPIFLYLFSRLRYWNICIDHITHEYKESSLKNELIWAVNKAEKTKLVGLYLEYSNKPWFKIVFLLIAPMSLSGIILWLVN